MKRIYKLYIYFLKLELNEQIKNKQLKKLKYILKENNNNNGWMQGKGQNKIDKQS